MNDSWKSALSEFRSEPAFDAIWRYFFWRKVRQELRERQRARLLIYFTWNHRRLERLLVAYFRGPQNGEGHGVTPEPECIARETWRK